MLFASKHHLSFFFCPPKQESWGLNVLFTYKHCCFKTNVSTIIWLLLTISKPFVFTIFYTDSLFTYDFPMVWSSITKCKSCFLLLFRYCFATKLSCLGFEPSLIQLCRPLNYALIPLFNNFSSLGIWFIYTFIVFPMTLLPHVVLLFDFLHLHLLFMD